MLKRYSYKKAYKKYTRNLKKDYISCVICANFKNNQHNMLIEEEMFARANKEMPYPNLAEYQFLEKVDLIDNRRIYGRSKKRRSLLCRP